MFEKFSVSVTNDEKSWQVAQISRHRCLVYKARVLHGIIVDVYSDLPWLPLLDGGRLWYIIIIIKLPHKTSW